MLPSHPHAAWLNTRSSPYYRASSLLAESSRGAYLVQKELGVDVGHELPQRRARRLKLQQQLMQLL